MTKLKLSYKKLIQPMINTNNLILLIKKEILLIIVIQQKIQQISNKKSLKDKQHQQLIKRINNSGKIKHLKIRKTFKIKITISSKNRNIILINKIFHGKETMKFSKVYLEVVSKDKKSSIRVLKRF